MFKEFLTPVLLVVGAYLLFIRPTDHSENQGGPANRDKGDNRKLGFLANADLSPTQYREAFSDRRTGVPDRSVLPH